MTLQAFGGTVQYPFGYQFMREPTILSTFAIGAGTYVAYIVRVPKTGTISKLSVYFGPGANPAGIIDYRIETVDGTTGSPTGTLWGTNTNISVSGHSGSDLNTMKTGTLTAGAVVTQGDELALVWRGGVGAAGRIGSFNDAAANGGMSQGYPYKDENATLRTCKPIVAIEYNDGVVYPIDGCLALNAINVLAYMVNDTPDEIGIFFQVPFKCRIRGAGYVCSTSGNGDYTVKLYDSNGTTVLTSVAMDKDNDAVGASTGDNTHFATFPASQTLLINTNYRLTLLPTTTTAITVYDFGIQSVQLADGNPGGHFFKRTSRTDAGSWTEDATRRPLIWLLLDAFDDAVSVGGESAMVFSG